MAELILEAKRLQELAGLPVNEDDADTALSQGLSALKDLDEVEGVEVEEDLNESVTGLVVSGLLASPKILEWIGKAVRYISKAFTGNDENKAADKLHDIAHKWEGYYLSAIKFAVKKLGIAKSVWSVDGKVDEDKLKTTAKILYAVILALAAGNATNTVLSHGSPAIKAIEGALGGIKGTEIAQIVSSIKGKI
jgi:hypothetical protein